jgi:hypothetical protein
MNIPLLPPGPVQLPPGCGVPPSLSNNANAIWLEHTITFALVPAFGGAVTVTQTVDVALVQGVTPATV